MERLTQKNERNTAYFYPECYKKCEGAGTSAKCDKCEVSLNVCNKLGNYEDAEGDGLLLKLLCKVGDTVYFPEEKYNFVFPVKISQIIISDLGNGKYSTQYNGCFFNGNNEPETEFEFDSKDFGKIVFLVQEEAEQELKEMEKMKH